MKKLLVPILYVVTLFLSCKTNPDLRTVENEIVQTEKDFSDYSAKNGFSKAMVEFADNSAVLLRENQYPVVGKKALRELLLPRNDTTIVLTWKPLFCQAATSADMGYTYGTYALRKRNSGDTIFAEGTFATVWKKQPDGKWRWVLDTGNSGLKPIETKQ